MQPIVNGLQTEFGNEITFLHMDAGDNAEGQQAFESLGLPGHPAYVILTPAGDEVYRSFGIMREDSLQSVIQNLLSNPTSPDAP